MSRPVASDTVGPRRLLRELSPLPPRWVSDLACRTVDVSDEVRGTADESLTLFHAHVERFVALDPIESRRRVADTYRTLASKLEACGLAPVRFWNFVPQIDAVVAPGLDRYMVFNAGRYDVCSPGQSQTAPTATASAVGVAGEDLHIYCLSSATAGTPVENPRQKSSWHYSPRYGPLPPCFARATVVDLSGRPQLLIGGTASIVGEESTHVGDPSGQIEETMRNLSAVVRAASFTGDTPGEPLERLVDIRAYVRNGHDADLVAEALSRRCPAARSVELVRATICRPELLIEIEAVACLGAR